MTASVGARTTAHLNRSVTAMDGRTIAIRTSETTGKPSIINVHMNGTLGTADMFDQMGEKLASDVNARSYAIGSRTGAEWRTTSGPTPNLERYADDVQRVVDLAVRENPGVPVAVTGTSLGGTVVEHFNVIRNPAGHPVLALAPVTFDKFMPMRQRLTVAHALTGNRNAAATLTDTPMSLGKTMTTNPLSKYHKLPTETMRVPAGLWRDDMLMNLDIAAHRGDAHGPLEVVLAGADQVNLNPVARVYTRILGVKPTVAAAAAHDLSQEVTNANVLRSLEGFLTRMSHRV